MNIQTHDGYCRNSFVAVSHFSLGGSRVRPRKIQLPSTIESSIEM